MKSVIKIEYEDKLPDALQETSTEFEEEAKMAMAIKLFEMKRLSSGTAASLAGISRHQFLLRLHEYNVNMIDVSDTELEQDFNNA